MKNWKQYIPANIKKGIRQCIRRANDFAKGYHSRFARDHDYAGELYPAVSIEQHIHLTAASQNKLCNLQLAIQQLNNTSLRPGDIFSFWRLTGKPTVKKGYLSSRSLQGGNLEPSIGGGLCQLSGLIYYLALQSGLEILERHPHSVDIYTEAERFTPLGSDATVTYGYKDLRFINTSPHYIRLQLEVDEQFLRGSLLASGAIEKKVIDFEYEHNNGQVLVKTWCSNDNQPVLINTSLYRTLQK